MQAGTADNIRVTVTGHYPLDAIVEAKNLLWNACDPEIIGEKAKRKDSASRTGCEAHVQDILHGLQKLDKNDQLPCVMINTIDMGMIPRSHPEELNNISVIDRLNRIETLVNNQQQLFDKTIAENIVLRERMDNVHTTYANVAARSATHSVNNDGVKTANRDHQQELREDRMRPTSPTSPENAQTPARRRDDEEDSNQIANTPPLPPAPARDRPPYQRGGRSGHGRDAGRGAVGGGGGRGAVRRGGRGAGRGTGQGARNHQAPLWPESLVNQLGRALSNLSQASTTDTKSSEDFHLPNHTLKKKRREENRRQRIITGNARPGTGRFRGAPEPSRDLFIYRVDPETKANYITDLVVQNDYVVRDIQLISNPSARFKSFFKMSVPISQINSLLTETFPWPEGVCVRRFITPRRERDDDY